MTTHSDNVLHTGMRAFTRVTLIATTLTGGAAPAQAQLMATDLQGATRDDLMRLPVQGVYGAQNPDGLVAAPQVPRRLTAGFRVQFAQ